MCCTFLLLLVHWMPRCLRCGRIELNLIRWTFLAHGLCWSSPSFILILQMPRTIVWQANPTVEMIPVHVLAFLMNRLGTGNGGEWLLFLTDGCKLISMALLQRGISLPQSFAPAVMVTKSSPHPLLLAFIKGVIVFSFGFLGG